MKPQRDHTLLPDDAVWVDDGTDPAADAEWLAHFQYQDRHYRLYETYNHRFQTGHPDNRILFGVVLIDSDEIERSSGGVLSPSPSMIGHLDSLPPRNSARNPERPLETYSSVGGSKSAFRFDSDVGFRLVGIEIEQDRIKWRSVRPLPPIARCSKCKGILASPLAKQCFHCGADWH
jgi:hypothetical protein